MQMHALGAKFNQNPRLAQVIKDTDKKRLCECDYDKQWFIGLSLWDKNLENIPSWKGNNLLGPCLEETWGQLKWN